MAKRQRKLYANYPKDVQDYMSNVIDCLRQDYGEIPTSWRISLDLIADNYNIYLKAKNAIDEEGLIGTDSIGRRGRNPNVSIMNVAQRTIMDLLKSFALTPMSKSKMKSLGQEQEKKEDYIDYLIND